MPASRPAAPSQSFRLRDFISDVYRAYPAEINLAVFFVLLASALEGVGFSAMMPLLSGLFSGQIPALGAFSGTVPDFFKQARGIWFLTAFILAIFLFKNLFTYVSKRFVERIAVNFETGMKKRVISFFLKSEWKFISSKKSGFLMSLVGEHSVMAANAFRLFIQFLAGFLQAAVYLGLGFLISYRSFLPSLLIGLVSFLAVKGMIVKSKAVSADIAGLQSQLHADLFEDLVAVKFLKANHLEPFRLGLVEASFDRLNKKMFQRGNYGIAVEILPEVVMALFVCLFLVLSRRVLGVPAEGVLVMTLLIYRLGRKVMEIQTARQRLVVNLPSFFILREFIREASSAAVVSGTKLISELETIEFKNVFFSHVKNSPVLREINFKINKNQSVALMGKSGSGKTTLLDLVAGLNHPEEGRVLVNGLNLKEADIFRWRDSLAYLSQDSVLYDMTIAENLNFGNAGVSREFMVEVCQSVGAHEFIMAQPAGYDTVIGNRGQNLSGGQRQKMALVRALLRKPQLLIMDEPTSALDPESEQTIVEFLRRMRGKITILLVSHRLSLAQNSDLIYVMEGGRLVSRGTFSEISKEQAARSL